MIHVITDLPPKKAHRSEWINRAAALYRDRKRHDLTSEHGYTLHVYETTCDAQALAALYHEFNADMPDREAAIERLGRKNEGVETGCSDIRPDFCGLSRHDYAKECRGESSVLMGYLDQARADLASSGLLEALESGLTGMERRRVRCFSDSDGDFQADRRWDAAPFMATRRIQSSTQCVEVCFPMTANADASRNDISVFNARCLALAEIIERLGYRVKLVGESWNDQGTRGGGDRVTVGRFVLREADQYGDLASLAPLVSTEFFRRVIFTFFRSVSDYATGAEHSPNGMVGATVRERPIPAAPGQLILDHNTINKLFSGTPDAAELFKVRLASTLDNRAQVAH